MRGKDNRKDERLRMTERMRGRVSRSKVSLFLPLLLSVVLIPASILSIIKVYSSI